MVINKLYFCINCTVFWFLKNPEIEMNSEPQRLTQAEKLRTEAKKIKKKVIH